LSNVRYSSRASEIFHPYREQQLFSFIALPSPSSKSSKNAGEEQLFMFSKKGHDSLKESFKNAFIEVEIVNLFHVTVFVCRQLSFKVQRQSKARTS
jgi:hypothetical protein